MATEVSIPGGTEQNLTSSLTKLGEKQNAEKSRRGKKRRGTPARQKTDWDLLKRSGCGLNEDLRHRTEWAVAKKKNTTKRKKTGKKKKETPEMLQTGKSKNALQRATDPIMNQRDRSVQPPPTAKERKNRTMTT